VRRFWYSPAPLYWTSQTQEDAAETLEAILENLHECIAADQQAPPGHLEQTNKDADVDKGCQPPCVAHQAFGTTPHPQLSMA
jgi:hypothetical protein